MIDKNEYFTLTYLYKDENDRCILICRGEVPAKEKDEADEVLSCEDLEDKEAVDKIVASIPAFSEAEPGSEETVCDTLDNFENKYNFSFEEIEEISGKDIDMDNEEGESKEHKEKVNVDDHEIESDELNDPLEVVISTPRSSYTDVYGFEEGMYEETEIGYDPAFVMEESLDTLEEAATPYEVVSKLVGTLKTKDTMSVPEVTEFFNSFGIFDPDKKMIILNSLFSTGNAVLSKLEGSNDIYISPAGKLLPVEYQKVNDPRMYVSNFVK